MESIFDVFNGFFNIVKAVLIIIFIGSVIYTIYQYRIKFVNEGDSEGFTKSKIGVVIAVICVVAFIFVSTFMKLP